MDCRVPSDPRTSTVPLASETRILPGENPLGDEAAAGSKNSSATPKRTAPYDPYEVRTVMRTRIGKLHSSCQSRQAALNQGVTCNPLAVFQFCRGNLRGVVNAWILQYWNPDGVSALTASIRRGNGPGNVCSPTWELPQFVPHRKLAA